MVKSKYLGYSMISALALLPLVYWLLFISDKYSFLGFTSIVGTIGKLLGLSGMILFSLTFLLNTRIKFIENLFNGLDKTYKAHHIIGVISFLFLLFHPLFLASRLIMSSLKQAFLFLLPVPVNGFAVNIGIFALLFMELFLIFTFLTIFKYQNWKFYHRILGFSFILASFHVLLIPSDVSRDLFLRVYFIIFIMIGICSYLYRTLFWKLLIKRYDYSLTNIKKLTDNITEITLKPIGKKLSFIPGQFVFLSFDSEDKSMKESHPFTISSSSDENDLRFSIKNLGDYTSKINKLKPNTKVKVEGPYGKFSILNYPSKKYVFVAGGIGITPFLSMIRSLNTSNNEDFESIDFYYCVVEDKEAVFLKELEEISKKLPKTKKLNINLFCSSKKGFINSEYIIKNSPEIFNSKIFICGPPVMAESIKQQFINSGIKNKNIIVEEFAL